MICTSPFRACCRTGRISGDRSGRATKPRLPVGRSGSCPTGCSAGTAEWGYSKNGATGSANDYFRASTFEKFDPEFVVYGPYDLPENMSYYGGNDASGNDMNPR